MPLTPSARSAVKVFVAAAVMFAFNVGAASSAHAANQSITVTCSGGAPVFSPSEITVGASDTVTLLNSSGGTLSITNINTTGTGLTWSAPPTWNDATTKVLTVTDRAGAGVSISGPAGCGGASTLGFGGGSDGTTANQSAPASILQQFGKPASSTCDAVAPESLNWSGVASGGWGESWSEWMNDGKGGAVCTRTLLFSTAQSKWIIV